MSSHATTSPFVGPRTGLRLGHAGSTAAGLTRALPVHGSRTGDEWLALVGFTDRDRRMGLLTPFGVPPARHEPGVDVGACRNSGPEDLL